MGTVRLLSIDLCASLLGPEVNLNGSIVANKGFIRTMSPGLKAVAAKYVSVWGGIQAAGQVVGQVLLQFVSDAVGRRIALLIIWVTLVVVSPSLPAPPLI